ncbi:MAG: DUF748 domain-containing protein [Pseudomonadota bacterium]
MPTDPSSAVLPRSFIQSRAAKVVLWLAVVSLLWTVLLGWALPHWAKPRVEVAATQALGMPVTLDKIEVQPWTLTVTLNGLTVGARPSALLQLPQAQVRLSIESLWRWAPVIRRITLTQPQVWIERQAAQRFNFTAMVERLQSGPATPRSEPARFALYNIQVQQGVVRYTDRVLQQEHRVEALNIGVPFVSNLPSFMEVDVKPLLEARVDGSAVRISGRSHPFASGERSTVELNWAEVDLARWMPAVKPFLPPEVQVAVERGRLDTALTLSFEERQSPAVAKLVVQGRMTVSDLAVNWPEGGVAGQWSSLVVEGVDALPLERQVKIAGVTLGGLQLQTTAVPERRAGKSGKPAPVVSAASSATASSPPWGWSVGRVRVAASRVQAQAPGGEALPMLGPVHLGLDGLDSRAAAAPAKVHLDATAATGGQLSVDGTAKVASGQATLTVVLSKWQAAPWLAPLRQAVPLPLTWSEGDVSAAGQLKVSPEGLSVVDANLQCSGVKTSARAAGLHDHVNLTRLDVQGVRARLNWADPTLSKGLNMLTVASVAMDQLDAQATRQADGRWALQPAASPSAAAVASASTAVSPVINLTDLRCTDCKVLVNDASVNPAARFSLAKAELKLKGVSSDLSRVVGFEFNGLGQERGRLTLSGEVRPQPLSLRTKLVVAGLDLRALQPYMAPHVNLVLVAAQAHAQGTLNLASDAQVSAASLKARYQGRVGLSALRTQDSLTEADFLSWGALSLDGVDASWQGGALTADLGRISLNDFYGRVIINPDGRLNLSEILRHEAGAQPKSLTTPQPATAVADATRAPVDAASKPPMNLRWQNVALTKGRVDFTDNFIKPNYSARLTQIQGVVSAVSSSKPEPATVKVSGMVDDSAPLQISGQLHPLGAQLYTDIQGSAKGIELTRLSPYAGRYAGYAIEKGSLSVNVHYKVNQGKLEAENKVFLDQLTFGQRVESPDATKLPVLLAVSLLKNSRGEIDVNLPISGSLDDPKFSVGGIIWRVVLNLIGKAVTAPFSLLFGGSHDELGFVSFDAGSEELSAQTRQRLDTLASKLMDRPQLKLEATGRADPAVDVEGLRQRHVERLVQAAKAKATGQTSSEVTVAPEERAQWLAAAYKAADIKKPRNVLGLAKTLPPTEMEALLKASAAADATALMTLANHRGDQVKAYLVSKLPAERVLLTASKVGVEGLVNDKGPTTRVQFTVK